MAIFKKIFPIAVFLLFAVLFHFGYPNINDGDAFYHIRHAEIYRTTSLFSSEFPWTQFSAIKNLGADLWYGFHLLLIPFTFFNDLILGMRAAGALFTTLSLLVFFLILKKLSVRYPLFWSLLLAFSAPDMLFRITMLRPHILTFTLAMLLLYFLASSRYLMIFLTSAAISFFHLALSWIAILVAGIKILSSFLFPRSSKPKLSSILYSLFSTLLGLIAGWLIRPNPFGALKLAYIQVVQLMAEKMQGVPLRFAAELKPADWSIAVNQFIPVLVFFIPAALFLWRLITAKKLDLLDDKSKTILISSFILAVVFLLLTAFVARRSTDFWLGYTFIFISLALTHYSTIKGPLSPIALLVGLAAAGIMAVNSFIISGWYRSQAIPPDKFQLVSWWLKENSQPGDIVINLHWDNFGMLFFWNQKNYYMGGMDPIFQYVYNPAQYWTVYFPEVDRFVAENNLIYTCQEIRCTADKVVDLRTALKENFKARYLLVERRRNPKLKEALESARGFMNVYETDKETVYEIL